MSKPRRVSPRQATLPLARRSDGGPALDRAQAQRSEMDTYVQSVAGGAAGEIERGVRRAAAIARSRRKSLWRLLSECLLLDRVELGLRDRARVEQALW